MTRPTSDGAGLGRVEPAHGLRVLVFGGTTEGRVLAERLATLPGCAVAASVATQLGAEELAGARGVEVLAGRLDGEGIAALLARFDVCVDATHPYAVEVTATIRAACAATGVPLIRLLRAPGAPSASAVPFDEEAADDVVTVETCADAAAYVAARAGRVLVTVGSKELAAFAGIDPGRLFARVLPTHGGIAACEALGLPHRNVLALQGPFTQRVNEALMEQYGIAWLVTKDGGAPGGFAQKLAAARSVGARTVVVGRPGGDEGLAFEDVLTALERLRIEHAGTATHANMNDEVEVDGYGKLCD